MHAIVLSNTGALCILVALKIRADTCYKQAEAYRHDVHSHVKALVDVYMCIYTYFCPTASTSPTPTLTSLWPKPARAADRSPAPPAQRLAYAARAWSRRCPRTLTCMLLYGFCLWGPLITCREKKLWMPLFPSICPAVPSFLSIPRVPQFFRPKSSGTVRQRNHSARLACPDASGRPCPCVTVTAPQTEPHPPKEAANLAHQPSATACAPRCMPRVPGMTVEDHRRPIGPRRPSEL
jgi:hypothetical protein